MKNMLDMQIELQNKDKQAEQEEKRAMAQKIATDHAEYEKDIAAAKDQQRAKNQANQQQVRKQIAERSSMLRTVGSNVILNQTK